ncbi:diaminopimelate epimerase [Chloroflexota bacterium]
MIIFTKVQGAGNDFILVEAGNMQRDWSQLAVAMCNRRFGVGADGLLLLAPSEAADFRMRVFNPDGSDGEACGNGLRCLVKYVMEQKRAGTDVKEVTIETAAGARRRFDTDGLRRDTAEIQVNMGMPQLEAGDIPMVMEAGKGQIVDIKLIKYPVIVDGEELWLHLVSMGNPHAVYFQDKPVADFPLDRIAPQVNDMKIFPNGANFEVVRVMDRSRVEARVWERGVGETLACGSGACAIAVATQLCGYVDRKVAVEYPGGTLTVVWDGAGEVLLSGPTETVFTGEWPE